MNKIIVIMGVSGCGKTTIGELLANELQLPFFDADSFHSKENVEKMSKGIPLNDADRNPWLETLASQISFWSKSDGAVLACSALKESYRYILSKDNLILWVYLSGSYELIDARMKQRNHFMKPALLQSQFDTLEVPNYGMHVSIENTPSVVVSEIMSKLNTSG